MSGVGIAAASSIIGVIAIWLAVTGVRRPAPSVASAMRSLHRRPDESITTSGRPAIDRLGDVVMRTAPIRFNRPTASALRVIGRRVPQHVGYLVAAGLLGLVSPGVITLLLRGLGVVDGITAVAVVPAVAGLVAAVVLPLLVHSITIERAAELRVDLRHQLSAFVDVVTMLLAGNTGHEGALQQAAEAGDGRLFRELRRRMREASTVGRSLVDALDQVAFDFDLDELAQIASTGRLAAAEGAPIARSLAAKCSTLRSTLATDQEAQARVRTDKVTPPLVAMTVLFMAVIIYPALNL